MSNDGKNKKSNIKKLLVSLKREGTVKNNEDNSSSSDIEQLLAHFRKQGQELCGSGNRTVTIARKRVLKCSFCKVPLNSSDNSAKANAGAAICGSCLKQFGKTLDKDDPEI